MDKNPQPNQPPPLKRDSPVRGWWGALDLKLQVAILAVLLSVPILVILGVGGIFFSQPIVTLLLACMLTAVLAGIIADRLTRRPHYQGLKNDESDLLEVENSRLSSQMNQLSHQQTQINRHRQLLSNLSTRVRQVPQLHVLYKTTVDGAKDILKADRVVIYCFNPDWTGAIVAEAIELGWPEALGDTIGDPCFEGLYAQKYQGGRIVATNDVYNSPPITDCYLRMLEQYRIKANLVVPIMREESLYGLLIAHQCSGPRVWSEEDINGLAQLATEVGFNLDYIEALDRQAQSNRYQQLMSSLSTRVRQVPEHHVLFKTTVDGARDILEADRVVIYRFNSDWTGAIVAEAIEPGWPEALGDTIGDPCFVELYTKKYQNGRIVPTNDVYNSPPITDCYLRMLEQYRIKANLVVPIMREEKLYGLLIAHQCSGPRVWKDEDINGLAKLATEVGFNLDYIEALEKQNAALKQAWFIGEIAFRARQTDDLAEVFQTTVQGTRKILRADRVLIYRFNPDWSGTMIAESVASEYSQVLHETIDDPCFRGSYVDLYKNGRVRAIHDIRKEPGISDCHVRTLEKYEVRANLVAPVRQNGQLIGLLIVHQCSEPRTWQQSDLDFISEVSTQLEYATDHLSFIERMQASTARARLFGDLAFQARQTLDENSVFRIVAQGALKLLHTDRVLVYRFNPDWSGTMVAEAVSSERWPKVLDVRIEDPCFRGGYVDLYRNGRIRGINDIYQEPGMTDCHIRTLEQYGVKANLVVPVQRDNDLYALLIAHQCAAPRTWQKLEMDFFSELATQTEYALDHLSFIAQLEEARQHAEVASQDQRLQTESIQQQLEALRQDVQGAFNGDLTVRAVPAQGDIGIFTNFLNATIENLQQIVIQVQSAAAAVTDTAQANEANVSALSSEALRQAEGISGALKEVQSMAASMQSIADNAQTAKLKVQQADQVLQEEDEAMAQTVEGISAIQATVEETAQQVKLLGEASQNISRVVSLIRDLASQTNVLALNASIEASSSSEQAQGFSVVAEEVRSLAEQSTDATREIEQIVAEIQADTTKVATAMESWREQVIAGSDLVGTAQQKLTLIATVSGEIRLLVEAMAQAAIAQTESSVSVSGTMQEVKMIAQHTSTQSRMVADSFTKLLEVAQHLQESVTQFKVQ